MGHYANEKPYTESTEGIIYKFYRLATNNSHKYVTWIIP